MSNAPGRVAVFGASGFIGRHLVRRLESLGIEVVIPITPEGNRINIAGTSSEIASSIATASVVVNAAGTAHIHAPDPARFWPANATGAFRVAEAVAAAPQARRLVHVSSAAVGSGGLEPPVVEAAPFTAYGASKAAGELGVAAALKGTPVELVVVRPAGIGGIDSPGSWGAIRRLVEAGRRVPLPNNDVRYDVVEIDEVIDFLVAAACEEVPAGIYALAGPGPVTLAEYAEQMGRVADRSARVVRVPEWLLRSAAKAGAAARLVTGPAIRVENLVSTLTDQRPLVRGSATYTSSTSRNR